MKGGNLLIALALVSSACVAARSYRLPLDAVSARDTFAPIAMVAGELGHEKVEHPDAIHVRYDEVTWIQFTIQNQHYNMVVVVDDNVVPPSELDAHFADARIRGDEIWKRALASMHEADASGDGAE